MKCHYGKKWMLKSIINHQVHKLVNRRNLPPLLFLLLPLKGCGTTVSPIDFCQKSSKNEDFEKGTPYWFLSKIIKNEDFEKGTPYWFLSKLIKKKGNSHSLFYRAIFEHTWKCIFLTLERKPGKFFLQKKDGGGSIFSHHG